MTDMTAHSLLSALAAAPRHVAGYGISARQNGCVPVCDSRKADQHSLFVCIRGERSDGHRYIGRAYEAGCRCFLVEYLPDTPLPDDADVFLSDNTRRDLALIAAAYYGNPARHMTIVGITGTKGKTTVALMCHHIANATGRSAGYIGTCGVMYGGERHATQNTTPGPLELHEHLFRMYHAGIKTVFLEVSSQALWQYRVHGISFAAVALTNLFSDHIGQGEHPDFDHYAACKKQLLTDYDAPFVLVNGDDPETDKLIRDVTGQAVVRCGIHTTAPIRACECYRHHPTGVAGTAFTYCSATGDIPVFLPLPGEYNVYNALFALTLTTHLGIDPETSVHALSEVRIPGRLEMLEVHGALVVIDYAHNGAALRAVLTALRPYAQHRLICLVGSVGERTQCRRAELGAAAGELADFTYLTADDPGFERVEDICRDISAAMPSNASYAVIPDRAEAIQAALTCLQAGDVLLLAGKGDEQFQKIDGRLVPHNDRAVVEAYLDTLCLPV